MELMNWRKASYSGNGGNCVEVANGAAAVAVRDSRDQEGARLAVLAPSWSAFVVRLKK
jgi:Domain of unknown function (DUF397)